MTTKGQPRHVHLTRLLGMKVRELGLGFRSWGTDEIEFVRNFLRAVVWEMDKELKHRRRGLN